MKRVFEDCVITRGKMKSIYTQKIIDEGLVKYLPDVNMTDRDKEIVKYFLEEDFFIEH